MKYVVSVGIIGCGAFTEHPDQCFSDLSDAEEAVMVIVHSLQAQYIKHGVELDFTILDAADDDFTSPLATRKAAVILADRPECCYAWTAEVGYKDLLSVSVQRIAGAVTTA
jgi:hypothetical protein